MSDSVRIIGDLQRNAELVSPKGKLKDWSVRLVIRQETCDICYLVIKKYGVDHAAMMAARSATNHMRAGSRVIAHGNSLRYKRIDGEAFLQLQDVSLVEHPSTAHHEVVDSLATA